MDLKILYEDNHLLVVVKPRGILSQEDHTGDEDLLTLLKQYLKVKYQKPGEVYLGLVHRLDRNTSGVMVFARTSKAAARLSQQIQNHEFEKKYYAVVKGVTKSEEELTDYLRKDEKLVKSFVTNSTDGKLAKLSYERIKIVDGNSLIKVSLGTGRHHQIRVQMANIEHPLLGDHLYNETTDTPMLLHAYSLSFLHPVTKERLVFENIPNDDPLWSKYFN